MKRFIFKIFLFIMPLILLYIFVEYKLRNIESIYELKRNGLIAQSDSIEILIVGNSHACDGINPLYFKQSAYNLAFGSQTILYDKQLILKYIGILKNLKYVIISLDYPSLYWGFSKDRDFFYYHYYGINIRNKSYFKENFSYFFYVYSPKTSVEILMNNNKLKLVDGWTGYDSTNYSLLTEKLGKKRVESFNADIKNSRQTKEHEYICSELELLIDFLKQKEIIPILITVPCYKYYTVNLDSNILESNLQYINKLKEKYNLVYLNSLNDTSFNASDFYNNDHLNKYGAEKYSKNLKV
ncbi:MAG: hypothetical protein IPG55_10285 [Saprospiraceae bacterium]|nr:hypothetical protein [Candidatus Defluviibacterium haderslevense]